MSEKPRHARVHLPEFGGVPAFVELTADRASAVMLARPIRSLQNSIGEEVTIEITTSGGLLQFAARLADVPEPEALMLDQVGDSQVIQRREFARVDAVLEMSVSPIENDGERKNAATVNVSGSGALIADAAELEVGDAVAVAMRLGTGASIVAQGRIVREFDNSMRALQFEHLLEADREEIVRFVFERQRMELARRRELS